MVEKKALITGVSGQDGSYLAERLLHKGYEVVGLTRDSNCTFGPNIAHLEGRLKLIHASYDIPSLTELLGVVRPSEIFNFAGQTFVSKSWDMLSETFDGSALIPTRILEAIIKVDRGIRFFQASTCEIFSLGSEMIFSERSRIAPGNPYGCAKAFAQNMVACYRKNYGIFAMSGILFHHESPRRHETFVSRKIVKRAVAIKLGKAKDLTLGNTTIARDWSYAPDLILAIEKMMQLPVPEDLVLSCGETHSLLEMVECIFSVLGLDYREYLHTDSALFRASESALFGGDNRRAKEVLDWEPQTNFLSMLRYMVEYEMLLQTGVVIDHANEGPFS